MQMPLARAAMPTRLFERLASDASARIGAAAVLVAGVLWALLCLALATAGLAPSVTWVPIPPERYYLVQAGFVVPVLLVQWLLASAVALHLGRAVGGAGTWSATASTMGFAMAAPLAALFLLPDLLVYGFLGFRALGALVRVTGPLTFVVTLALVTLAMRTAHRLSSPKAFAVALVALVVQAVPGAILLR
jgi:hypothetical protein